MNMSEAVDKIIAVASAEVGYLEKKSNAYLDDKTKNAGSNNYTKYSRDLVALVGSPYSQGTAWCDMFVDWCCMRAFGKDTAKEMIGGWSAYTPTSAQYYKNMGRWFTNPKAGDQIFFKNSSRICHTGLVYKVDSKYVYTIEGNTSGASGVVANGGGVCKKKYALKYINIAGYGRPKYELAPAPAPRYVYKGIDLAPVFDPKYYSSIYSDLRAAFGDDVEKLFSHFTTNGMREGRQAISTFNPKVYKENYKDLRDAFGDYWPSYYTHYCTCGKAEGRKAF